MRKLLWVSIPAAIVIMYFSLSNDSTNDEYIAAIEEQIDARKRFLEFSDQSPFKQYDKEYKEPSYFPIDDAYRVDAKVQRIEKREVIIIQNSEGKDESYLKYAWLSFSLKGQSLKLLVLKPIGFASVDILFCGFADETSGITTYGGGRYLDIKLGKSNRVTLDFNLAYNPYCAYVDGYTCPLPPAENILPVGIEAGEKDFSRDI